MTSRRQYAKPVFLHFVNRELHEALRVRVNIDRMRDMITAVSVLLRVPQFCNISQVYEVFHDRSDILNEIIGLADADLMVAHSDFPTMPEFLESRREIYHHDRWRYRMYFDDPGLGRAVPLGSMGHDQSTTKHIQENLQRWRRNPDLAHIARIANFRDLDSLNKGRPTIARALEERGEQALTWAYFRPFAGSALDSQRFEGAVRRILSLLYMDHYLGSFDANQIWGFHRFDTFDLGETLIGLYAPMVELVFKGSGLGKFLGQRPQNGLPDRLTTWEYVSSRASSDLYIRLCATMDRIVFENGGGVRVARLLVKEVAEAGVFDGRCAGAGSLPSAQNALMHQMNKALSHIRAAYPEQAQKEDQEMRENAAVVLVTTATDSEDVALMDVFGERMSIESETIFLSRNSYLYLGTHFGCAIYHVRSSAGALGSSSSSVVLMNACADLSPDYIISCGVCMGMQSGKQELGDIAISTALRLYEPQRVNPIKNYLGRGTVTLRGDRASASPLLLDRCRAINRTWQGATVHQGLFLTGEKLVDRKSFRDALLRVEPEAVACEMEGSGLLSVAQREGKEWIVVKGICDWGFGKTKAAQPRAARNAFLYFYEMISKGALRAEKLFGRG